jgi:hypothetical protein
MKTYSISVILETLAVTDLVGSLPPEFIGDVRNQSLVLLDCDGPGIDMRTTMAIRKNHFMVDRKLEVTARVGSLSAQSLDSNTASEYTNTTKIEMSARTR